MLIRSRGVPPKSPREENKSMVVSRSISLFYRPIWLDGMLAFIIFVFMTTRSVFRPRKHRPIISANWKRTWTLKHHVAPRKGKWWAIQRQLKYFATWKFRCVPIISSECTQLLPLLSVSTCFLRQLMSRFYCPLQMGSWVFERGEPGIRRAGRLLEFSACDDEARTNEKQRRRRGKWMGRNQRKDAH